MVANKFVEGFVMEPKVGGVHLGKIPLRLLEQVGGRYTTYAIRSDKVFHSGQAYIPIFKKIIMKEGANNLRLLGALPAMVSNLMMPTEIHASTKEEKHEVDELIRALVDIYKNIKAEIDMSNGNNCIRWELFYSSKFDNNNMSFKFPEMPLVDFCMISGKNSYFKTYVQMMGEIITSLEKTILESNILTYDALSASAKRMVTLCAEMAVTMTEFHPFNPKGMNKINKLLKDAKEDREREANRAVLEPRDESEIRNNGDREAEQGDGNPAAETGRRADESEGNGQDETTGATGEAGREGRTAQQQSGTEAATAEAEAIKLVIERLHNIMFNAPFCFLDRLSEAEEKQTGMKFGLKPVIMTLPEYAIPERLHQDDLRTRMTEYIANYLKESSDKTKLMNHYVYVAGKVMAVLWHYAGKKEGEGDSATILDLPDFEILAHLPVETKEAMVRDLAKIVCNVYDFEWWWITLQNTKKHFNKNREFKKEEHDLGGPQDFPTTVDQAKNFKGTKIQVDPEELIRPTEIKCVGKYQIF